MLTKEDNDLLTRVEKDAIMGKMLRQYWVPALRSEAVIEDGDPVRVRLFGENFVVFRATDGRVGMFDEACPHRGASMLLARNEDCGLTCIFHGWKFDVSGKAVSVPTEPEENHDSFCSKVPLKSYPIKESGTIIWVYVGSGEPPEFPAFEFCDLPEENIRTQVAYLNCNWLQGLEGTIDSSHVGILHQFWIDNPQGNDNHIDDFITTRQNLTPRYEFEKKDYGYRGAALRDLPNNKCYARITEFVAPWYSFIPFAPNTTKNLIVSIPVDDEHSAQWYIHYNIDKPIEPLDESYGEKAIDLNNFYTPPGTFENRWRQDRELLKKGHWTGAESLLIEDFIVQESMGPIVDRTKEFLNSADAFIGRVRRLLLKSAKDFNDGEVPFGIGKNIAYHEIRATAVTISKDDNWKDAPK